ncbi:hypothetical protein TNCT_388371 [Trichonephila clavata]|uniref:Uncharacterized protein n=1 Tax=Trichonephila clavata TaxID=2740835 RepID=A0A8X6KLF8_TRICU|nr:hypothetical protein TNCT_388371 [Trichonephila clavata]
MTLRIKRVATKYLAMNCLVITCLLFLVVGAHSMPFFYPWWFAPYYSHLDNEYGTSLGGAPIGLYNRRRDSGPYGESSEVSGVSQINRRCKKNQDYLLTVHCKAEC